MTGSGDKVRTFIAVLIPDAAREVLYECIQQLSGSATPGVRWVDPEGIHLTLRFLGDIPVERVEDVLAAQGVASGSHEPFSLQLSGLGMFPNRDRPRVLWAGVSGDMDALRLLQEEVEAQLERCRVPQGPAAFRSPLDLGANQGQGLQRRAKTHRSRDRVRGAWPCRPLGGGRVAPDSQHSHAPGGHLYVVGGSAPVLGCRVNGFSI